jgi:hypothetical protein
MTTIHIHTQYQENYGDAAMPYWKFKGGNTYIVTGLDLPLNDQIGRLGALAVEALRSKIEYANDYAQEHVIDWEFAPADALTRDEQLQMEYDGRIIDPSPRLALANPLVS